MRRPGRRSGGTGPQPRTVVGRWLRALLLHDDQERDRLLRQLNRGKAGWSKDEAGVMQAACDLAVLQYFGSDYDVRQISEAVSLMRDAELAGGKTPHRQLEMEAVIRHALGETDAGIQGIKADVGLRGTWACHPLHLAQARMARAGDRPADHRGRTTRLPARLEAAPGRLNLPAPCSPSVT